MTVSFAHDPPPFSGNAFRPHDIVGSDCPIVAVSAGISWLHFEGLVALTDVESSSPSSIDAERSSTRKISTGLRLMSKVCSPHIEPPTPTVTPVPPAPLSVAAPLPSPSSFRRRRRCRCFPEEAAER